MYVSSDTGSLREVLDDRVFAAFHHGVDAAPGATDVLAGPRHRELPNSVASSSDHAWIDWIDLTLGRSGLRARLPASGLQRRGRRGRCERRQARAPKVFLPAARAMGGPQ